jgi:hypothetical protein
MLWGRYRYLRRGNTVLIYHPVKKTPVQFDCIILAYFVATITTDAFFLLDCCNFIHFNGITGACFSADAASAVSASRFDSLMTRVIRLPLQVKSITHFPALFPWMVI